MCLSSDVFLCNSFFICRWWSISALWSNDRKTCSLVRKQGPGSEFVERVSAAVSCMYRVYFRTLQGLFSSVSGRATHALLWFMISRITLAFLCIHTPHTNFGHNHASCIKLLSTFWNHTNLVISKSRSCVALFRFLNYTNEFRPNFTSLRPISIITDLPNTKICWKEKIYHLLHIHHDYLNILERKFNFEVIKMFYLKEWIREKSAQQCL